ncbi:DNA-processing protein DprA [Macrococcoides caseolyticum]|uniref:DNA-processing protein DprA n=1 Tax=Macrococcoides caseolyticum TaxID=69966 RepID=A0A855GH62_9STAP|nr:DNA-processing protein DprA [Macrococcus caseolyticus]TDL36094.1 DNA-processing protein DprA [Macrococcus bohemicus]PKE11817.1 DNA-processing protein DprA [Macrococcus caseolyticus]PKE17466.1 DNA-processing protein DprA [Macrococcus caseolyticus]PKE19937.1 DNA-processing protein DprA [Macrococcus caseolyticus]
MYKIVFEEGNRVNRRLLIFILYDLGISPYTLFNLYYKASDTQLQSIINGDILKIQFEMNVFTEKEVDILYSQTKIENSIKIIKELIYKYEKEGIRYILYMDKEYPSKLKNIDYPPFILFVKGNTNLLNDKIISIVGTRKPSQDTKNRLKKHVKEIVRKKLVIASGLAIGTDIYSHNLTLDNKGKTIAVLPSAINDIIPKIHEKIAGQIVEDGGLLISEYYKPIANGSRLNYIYRNRLVSGISTAVLVAECEQRSGTMHTARFAYKQSKIIFCFKNISSGNIKILKTGIGKEFQNVDDLLNNLGDG